MLHILCNLARPSRSLLKSVSTQLEVHESFLNLLIRIDHKRSILNYSLIERFPSDQDEMGICSRIGRSGELNPLFGGLRREDEGVVVRMRERFIAYSHLAFDHCGLATYATACHGSKVEEDSL